MAKRGRVSNLAALTTGAIFFGEKMVGTFEVRPFPHEELVVKFQEGLRVAQIIELATEAGMPLQLMAMPEIPE